MRIILSLMIFSLSYLFTLARPDRGPGVVAFYEGSFEQMKTQAHQEQKPYLLSFHDDGIPSRNLERFTYTSPKLANYVANNYLAMQFSLDDLDDLTAQLVDRYQVILFPTIVLFSAEGKMLYRFTGFTGDQAFAKMLESYRFKLETDMSMTFPPEPYIIPAVSPISQSESKEDAIGPTELIFEDLKEDEEPPNVKNDIENIQITELNDLEKSPTSQQETELLSSHQRESETPKSEVDPALSSIDLSTIEDIPVLPKSNLIVQTGVYSEKVNAQKEQARLKREYSIHAHIDKLYINGQYFYRVRLGPFDADRQATYLLKHYNTQEQMNAIIKTLQN